MKQWPYQIRTLTFDEIHSCIHDDEWQALRRDLKGRTTENKLQLLAREWTKRVELSGEPSTDFAKKNEAAHTWSVCIINYLNALKRGGQLNMDLEVVK